MKNCFQGNRVFSSSGASGFINSHHQYSFEEKENAYFPRCKSVMKSSSAASSSSFAHHPLHLIRASNSPFLCHASADYVDVVTACSWNDRVVASDDPVLVEFWAPQCGPCEVIEPIVGELAKEYTGKILCYKLNTEDCPTIASQYEIKSIPSVLLFKDGEKKECVVGAVHKSALTAAIEKCLE